MGIFIRFQLGAPKLFLIWVPVPFFRYQWDVHTSTFIKLTWLRSEAQNLGKAFASFANSGRIDRTAARSHDDVIKWKHFPRYWPFVRGIHRSTVNSPHKGQWRGALMYSLICVWINGWVNNREAGDLRRYPAHYDVTVMTSSISMGYGYQFEDQVAWIPYFATMADDAKPLCVALIISNYGLDIMIICTASLSPQEEISITDIFHS